MSKERISIDLGFALLTAEKEPSGDGISICLEDNKGNIIQDVVLVHQCDKRERGKKVRCLVWADELQEDYTDSYMISMYEGG